MSTLDSKVVTILQYAAYGTQEGLIGFERNRTGFGYMVMDISKSIAQKPAVKVSLITYSGITSSKVIDGIIFSKHTVLNALFKCRLSDVARGLLEFCKELRAPRQAVRTLISHVFLGEMVDQIQENRIIHVHGACPVSLPVIRLAIRMGRRPIVTLHGLNSIGMESGADAFTKKCERDVLSLFQTGEIALTVLTPKAKGEVLDFIGTNSGAELKAITNGIDIGSWNTEGGKFSRLREKLGINVSTKIGLYIGNISVNKNQYQLVNMFSKLDKNSRPDVIFMLIGDSSGDVRVNEIIRNNNLEYHFRICGTLDRLDISEYYSMADFTILLSKSEGYGLSLVEGYIFGIPAIMFNDLDAAELIYSKETTILIPDRTDEKILQCLAIHRDSKWDKSTIREHGQKFDIKYVASEYLNLYNELDVMQ